MLLFEVSRRGSVSPESLDMVEVGGSNPPGPTKRQTLASSGGFLFGAALAADLNRPVRHIPT